MYFMIRYSFVEIATIIMTTTAEIEMISKKIQQK